MREAIWRYFTPQWRESWGDVAFRVVMPLIFVSVALLIAWSVREQVRFATACTQIGGLVHSRAGQHVCVKYYEGTATIVEVGK